MKFNDASSNAALGTDSSGNGNTWTVNGISATTSTTSGGAPTVTGGGPGFPSEGTAVANLWDGSTSSYPGDFLTAADGGIITISWPTPITGVTQIEYYSYNGSDRHNVNDGGWSGNSGTGGGYKTAYSGSAIGLSKLQLQKNDQASYVKIGAIRLNGSTVLTTSNYTSPDQTITTDSVFDSPTDGTQSDTGAGGEVSGNYATMNPLNYRTSTTYSNGNLQLASSANYRSGVATIPLLGGKYYFEGVLLTDSNNGYSQIGITLNPDGQTYPGANGPQDGFGWYGGSNGNGQLYYESNVREIYSGWTVGDIVSVAYDSATRKCWIAKNGTWQNSGNPAAGTGSVYTIPGTAIPYFSISTGTGGEVAANFGQRAFAHTAPSGFKPLCTTNLPTPAIADGSDYFDIDIYEGNNSTNERSEFSFSPDFVWIKSTSNAYNHYLWDSVRGATKYLMSHSTDAEGTMSNGLTSFDSDGFTLGNNSNINYTNRTMVAWAWDAGANSSKTFTVKVVSDSGNKYRFDDLGTSAVTLDLEEGSTYVFDQSDSSNSGHPLRFSTTANGTHGGGTEYTTGVTVTGTPGQAGAKTTIVVAASAPTLYYYCTNHSGMGGQANTNSTAGSSNFDGSIQTTVKANQSAGFSIVTYTGVAPTVATVGHGLNAAPDVIIIKVRDRTGEWPVFHSALNISKTLYLEQSAAQSAGHWNSTAPTSSVFTIGDSAYVNGSGDPYVAYCFTSIEGYSAFGSYTGNGSSDGPFVYTRFRPAFIMGKRSDASNGWFMFDSSRDSFNVADTYLAANANAADQTFTFADFLSNGFKLRATTSDWNGSGGNIVYMAFAEHPFKTARAR